MDTLAAKEQDKANKENEVQCFGHLQAELTHPLLIYPVMNVNHICILTEALLVPLAL